MLAIEDARQSWELVVPEESQLEWAHRWAIKPGAMPCVNEFKRLEVRYRG